MDEDGLRLSRRSLLRGGAVAGVALFVPVVRAGRPGASAIAVAAEPGGPGFLTKDELATLRALVDRFVPGPPEDPDPGAVEAGCAEAIDALLAAFDVDPPRIYAGAPWSDRGGAATNHFAEFLPLDPYEERAWRLKVEGSRGVEALEFNGPVRGWQATYREGLAALDAAAGGDFAALPGPARDLVLRGADDPDVAALVDVAFPHTLEFMYGAPEYGGNRDLVAWAFTRFDGDVQPRGWTDEEVTQPDQPGPQDLLPALPLDEVATVAALGTAEAAHGMLARSGGTTTGLRVEGDVLRRTGRPDGVTPTAAAAAIEAVRRTIAGDDREARDA